MAESVFKTPLLLSSPSDQLEEPPFKRTGTVWTAVAHIITGVIGSGVLSLAWCMAQLGWIAGPLTMLCFALVTIFSAFLLSDCYRSPDPEYGPLRYRSYREAVRMNLGRRNAWLCAFSVNVSMYGLGVAYTITSAISMQAIQKSNCYHDEGHSASCDYGDTYYMLLFGAIQIVMCQLPNFHNLEWLSVTAAIMSFAYSSIGLGLGFAKTIGNGEIKGNITGVSTSTALAKSWLVAQAVGDIAFAYPYSIILIDIQDTLKTPPPENKTMKKATIIAVFITTLFYISCGGFGYAAFGDDTPGNLLTGFGFYEPYWLIDFANACIVLHLVGGYQVYSQPLFATIDTWFAKKFPNNAVINAEYTLDFLPGLRLNIYRLCFRTAYVATTTGLAMAFPYFNGVIGLLGGFTFWPLAIYFPVEMYIVQKHIRAWTRIWFLFRIFSIVCLAVTVFALAGSIEGLIAQK